MRKKPTLELLKRANRQDLALHAIWIPLAAAAERCPHVQGHVSRHFPPEYDLRYDGQGAAFMGHYTRMIAAPDEPELSVGFPSCWKDVLRAAYRQLDALQVDTTALFLFRLMCEAPIQLCDIAMCHLAAQMVRDSGCSVEQSMLRCHHLLEHALLTSIDKPAYDAGRMAHWMWTQRYLQPHCHWNCAIYHELGLPYTRCGHSHELANHLCPAQIWPQTNHIPERSTTILVRNQDGTHEYGKTTYSRSWSCQIIAVQVSVVFISIFEYLDRQPNHTDTFRAARLVCKDWKHYVDSVMKRPNHAGFTTDLFNYRLGLNMIVRLNARPHRIFGAALYAVQKAKIDDKHTLGPRYQYAKQSDGMDD